MPPGFRQRKVKDVRIAGPGRHQRKPEPIIGFSIPRHLIHCEIEQK